MNDDTVTPPRFTLQCERREDGGIRVTCPEVSGLILSGNDVRSVLGNVAPALHQLMLHMQQAAKHEKK